jgi:hypothetical protein
MLLSLLYLFENVLLTSETRKTVFLLEESKAHSR